MHLQHQESEPGSVRDGLIVGQDVADGARIPTPWKKDRTSRLERRAMEALEMERIRAEKFGEDHAEGILLANQADQRKISENKVVKFDDWKSKQGDQESERTARGSSWERAINAEARNRD